MRWWLAVAFAAVGLMTASSLFLFVNDSSREVIDERSEELALGRASTVARRLGESQEARSAEILANSRTQGFAAWVYDSDGELITPPDSSGVSVAGVEEREEAVSQALTGGRFSIEDRAESIYVVSTPIFRDNEVDGVLLARSARSQALEGALDQLRGDALTALGIAALLGVVIGLGVAYLITRRVKRLARAAGQLAAGRFDVPLHEPWRDELGDLTRSLDWMREALRESFNVLTSERDKLSTIFAGLNDAVIVVGYDGELRFSNPAGDRLLEGDTPVASLQGLLRRAADKGKAETDAMLVGDHVYAVHARDLPAEQAVLAAIRDRTEELRREMSEREFISNAAHELRNPIAGISSSIEVLSSGAKDDPEAREHFLDRLAHDTERLTRIIQALLTLARVESVDHSESGVADIGVCVEEAVAAMEAPEGIDVSTDVPAELASAGDPVLLRQVLVGLVSNAYKHTQAPGAVTLRARNDGGERVVIEVEDTGTGISPEDQERVFERFFRAESAREKDGVGLGLAIARRMVDVMGGEIGVRSTVGEGATFWIRLPAAKPTPTPVP